MTDHCYFARFSDEACDLHLPLQRAHVIPQRVLKQEHSRANPRTYTAWEPEVPLTGVDLRVLLDDSRNWRPACDKHHHKADQLFLDYEIPESVREFAAEYGLDHYLPAREIA